MIFASLNEFEDRIVIRSVDLNSVPEYNKLVINISYTYRDKFNNTQEANAMISIAQ